MSKKKRKKITVETEIEFQRMIPHFHVSGIKVPFFHHKKRYFECVHEQQT